MIEEQFKSVNSNNHSSLLLISSFCEFLFGIGLRSSDLIKWTMSWSNFSWKFSWERFPTGNGSIPGNRITSSVIFIYYLRAFSRIQIFYFSKISLVLRFRSNLKKNFFSKIFGGFERGFFATLPRSVRSWAFEMCWRCEVKRRSDSSSAAFSVEKSKVPHKRVI